ncbi:P-loop containing nucleoside triphosphate hydrolase protein [Echria macrotheca]|uniref:P-loop containing nucleoside triphosphate hydrolase protein n=1 Tax=Echria macrotheca TaxID=438768 RepID=A0AAJ0BL06_9PEZI|nr:P-loop containing nucleoside triphosphate hydrolase protein [Echria macrotheca]
MSQRNRSVGVKREAGQPAGMVSPTSTIRDSSIAAALRITRSDAPSVDTRRITQSALGDGDEEGELLLMEVKPRAAPIKVDETITPPSSFIHHGSFAGPAHHSSFIGPNRALKDFGQPLKAINDALGELQARGIQHVVDLPELVLVGDQSSGKSSLMSAIAGLTLPRSSGTCTRCPIHIRVSRADEWSCRVYLKKDFKYVPRDHPITKQDVTARDKFPPWVALDPTLVERCEFKTVRDRFDSEEIETVLRCAQVAILNPRLPYQQFIPKLKGEAEEETRRLHLAHIRERELNAEAQFSPNTVALEVKGPDLADLNFYDLPGVFMSAKRDEDTFLERVVRNLACEYISRPNAIILWAVPMNQDADNSYAFSLIRERDAGDRCVGVMTKADLLPTGSSASWLAMLKGDAHRTGLGYFITSRQGDDLDHQNAMEEAFFNRTADAIGDWPPAFDGFNNRCGVEKLKAFLSEKLGEQFAQVLPQVKDKVKARISEIEMKLQDYPEPPPNPEMHIMRGVAAFSRDVKDRVTDIQFLSGWDRECLEELKNVVLNLKPRFNVKEISPSYSVPSTPKQSTPARPVFITIDDDSPSMTRKRNGAPETPSSSKRQRQERGHVKVEPVDRPGVFSAPAPPFHGTPVRSTRPVARKLMDIRILINQNATPGQPGLVSPQVYTPLYTDAARMWAGHLDHFVNKTLSFLEKHIMSCMHHSFQHMKNTVVYRESKKHLAQFISERHQALSDQLRLIHRLESSRLFTKDEESLSRHKTQEKKMLVRHRHHWRWAAHCGTEDPEKPRNLNELTEEERAQEALKQQKEAAKMGPDPFEHELEVAAYVRGYYLTAANRFIDNVALHVMAGLFPHVSTVIDNYLHEKLGLSGHCSPNPDLFRQLMSEGPETERRRRELKAEIDTLEQAMSIIVNLENDNSGGSNGHPNGLPILTTADPSRLHTVFGPGNYAESELGNA